MVKKKYNGNNCNIGFLATRLAGTDGVTLETAKWVKVLEDQGYNCFFFAGELDFDPEKSYLAEEAHFMHPEIRATYLKCFGKRVRSRAVTKKIYELKEVLKKKLYRFVNKFDINLLIPENSLTIPLNLSLGIAITELIAETGMPTVAHHHDFFWERQHFITNAAWDFLNMAFPPHLPSIQHVVINSSADNQLSLRTGISGIIIPNVMDFENPPAPPDAYAADVRKSLGVADDELLVLQPTRVVKRKGIEHAIELVQRLNHKAKLVISHASGDEGYDYENRVRQYADFMNVDTIFVCNIINEKRGKTKDGRKIYTLEDIYPHADLVTYPSTIEGFGNAFLESVYFKKPIVLNTYSIYEMDIKPKGFSVIEMEGYVAEKTVAATKRILKDKARREKMVQQNYETARRHYSYAVLKRKLGTLIPDCFGAARQNNDL
jgi:glycosyltransferase involved in cell wall biosynthesis